MKFEWEKPFLIYEPSEKSPWMSAHSQMPIYDRLEQDQARVYFTSRNSKNQSLPTFIELDPLALKSRSASPADPFLSLGKPGAFDDAGVMPSCLVRSGHKTFMYYIGWNVPSDLPFRNSIGLAASEDGGRTFRKFSDGPVLERNPNDPYFVSTPFVLIEGSIWKMWYISGLPWRLVEGKWQSSYNIRYAESTDGVAWTQFSDVAIALRNDELAVARPAVIRIKGQYCMWFCYRRERYHLGFATSFDGRTWTRQDETNIPSLSGGKWDSEMQAYPSVHLQDDRLLLFYNGNDFGQTGIACARSGELT